MTIRGVLLDYGGVLIDMRWSYAAELEREHELPRGSIVRTLYVGERWNAVQSGARPAAGWLDEAHAELEQVAGRSLPALHARWREAQNLIGPNIELVRSLREGYKLAVLSNADETLVHRLTHVHEIADLFDVLICSAEVKVVKPDPAIYRLTAQRLRLEPSECVFVDDSPPNVDAAIAVGMSGILFRVDRGDDLAAQLAELGVGSSEPR